MKKTRKLLSTMLALTLGVAATVGVTACGGQEHTHNFAGYGYDVTHHWLACEACDETKDEERHVDNGEGFCKTCAHLIPTECVTYAISADGAHAIVTGYDETDTNVVVISPTYNDLPVREIADSAFADCKDLERITLTDTITTIGDDAFSGCGNLTGIMLYESVTSIGDNAFGGCDNLTIFCEAESQPESWGENWNASEHYTVWGYTGERMAEVSAKAIPVSGGMLAINDPERAQIVENEDLGGVKAPTGFSTVTRYDVRQEGVGAWESSALWNYNYDKTDLKDYAEVWFAAKAVNAYWALGKNDKVASPNWDFLVGNGIGASPWVYVHLKQTGQDYLGYILWDIEVSIGGYVFARIESQSGKPIDKDRTINSLARMLWDEGFGSADGSTVLFYSENTKSSVFYCTEVVGVRVGV